LPGSFVGGGLLVLPLGRRGLLAGAAPGRRGSLPVTSSSSGKYYDKEVAQRVTKKIMAQR